MSSAIAAIEPPLAVSSMTFTSSHSSWLDFLHGLIYFSTLLLVVQITSGAKAVDVTLVDGNTYTAKEIGTDLYSNLALLQITDNFSAENGFPIMLANSFTQQVGQQVLAFGPNSGLVTNCGLTN
ncbi:MAG TPA: hypothetical protein VFI73_03775 [Candidatus Nitrosopolaris sp.]|nr:hypothetical protein [Candidatus Nitrosopolaris sp.]